MKSCLLVLALMGAACASSRAPGGGDDGDDDAPVDAAAIDAAAIDGPDDIDAPTTPIDAPATPIDGPPATMVTALVVTEVSLAPNGGELIEVLNPTGVTVDLSSYYLTDVPTYFRLPSGAQTVDSSDFIAKFPAGSTLAPGGVVTVAMDTTANFTTALGTAPTYSVASGTMTVVQVTGAATLTNTGEPVILFFWNGATDRVTDIDIMVAGVPSAGNALINKSATVVDGPDADTSGTAYATDAMTIAAQAGTPGSALSTKRLALESAATEVQTGGGNGANGHDETSEQTAVTWDSTGFTAPTPGAVPPALMP